MHPLVIRPTVDGLCWAQGFVGKRKLVNVYPETHI